MFPSTVQKCYLSLELVTWGNRFGPIIPVEFARKIQESHKNQRDVFFGLFCAFFKDQVVRGTRLFLRVGTPDVGSAVLTDGTEPGDQHS